jgi:hypothetical protein
VEKLMFDYKKRQGTTSQLAEKLIHGCKKRQGTTSPLAEKIITEGGGGFNPRIMPIQSTWALAPEGCLSSFLPVIPSFSATTSQFAEKLIHGCKKRQGTTSVVP